MLDFTVRVSKSPRSFSASSRCSHMLYVALLAFVVASKEPMPQEARRPLWQGLCGPEGFALCRDANGRVLPRHEFWDAIGCRPPCPQVSGDPNIKCPECPKCLECLECPKCPKSPKSSKCPGYPHALQRAMVNKVIKDLGVLLEYLGADSTSDSGFKDLSRHYFEEL